MLLKGEKKKKDSFRKHYKKKLKWREERDIGSKRENSIFNVFSDLFRSPPGMWLCLPPGGPRSLHSEQALGLRLCSLLKMHFPCHFCKSA